MNNELYINYEQRINLVRDTRDLPTRYHACFVASDVSVETVQRASPV